MLRNIGNSLRYMIHKYNNLGTCQRLTLTIWSCIPRLEIAEHLDGSRSNVRDGSEIIISKPARSKLIKTLHNKHAATETMFLQCHGCVFRPKIELIRKSVMNNSNLAQRTVFQEHKLKTRLTWETCLTISPPDGLWGEGVTF